MKFPDNVSLHLDILLKYLTPIIFRSMRHRGDKYRSKANVFVSSAKFGSDNTINVVIQINIYIFMKLYRPRIIDGILAEE